MDYPEAAGRLMDPDTREAIQIVFDYVRTDFYNKGWADAIKAASWDAEREGYDRLATDIRSLRPEKEKK